MTNMKVVVTTGYSVVLSERHAALLAPMFDSMLSLMNLLAEIDGEGPAIGGHVMAAAEEEVEEEDDGDLTRAQQEEYIANGGNLCPVCQSNDIDVGETDFKGSVASTECRCNYCDSSWSDVYVLKYINPTYIMDAPEEEGDGQET